MKALRENSLLFAALTAFVIVSGSRFPLTVFVISLLVWHHRVHRSELLLILLFCLLLVRIRLPETNAEKGIVTEVKSSYVIISDGLNKTMLKGEREAAYGDVVRVTGEYEPLTSVPGFFAFDFAAYCRHKRIFASADAYVIEGHVFSLRYFIDRRIGQLPESLQPLLYKVLLQRSTDQDQTGWLFEHGLSLTALVSFLDAVMGFFLKEKVRRRLSYSVLVVLGLIYHFPVSITLSLLLRSFPKAERKQKTGIVLAAVLFLYPYALYSLSFLMPALILVSRTMEISKLKQNWLRCLLMSAYQHHIAILTSLLYPAIRLYSGLVTLACWLLLAFPLPSAAQLLIKTDALLPGMDALRLNGSVMGTGLLFYVLTVGLLPKGKTHDLCLNVSLFAFLALGLFHPLGEVTYINVGQGDSILIRQPFNTHNILIDTGKPMAVDLLTDMLEGKGITKIHTLIITHQDDDHSGNMEYIIDRFHPDRVILSHEEKTVCGRLVLYDLNRIEDEDENRSSIASVFYANGITYVMTGDMDRIAEERLVRTFGGFENVILKASHHGSKTGSCERFLNALKPMLTIISCGAYTLYRHPAPETLQRLKERHIPWLTTREEGDITVLWLPGFNLLITASGKLAIIDP